MATTANKVAREFEFTPLRQRVPANRYPVVASFRVGAATAERLTQCEQLRSANFSTNCGKKTYMGFCLFGDGAADVRLAFRLLTSSVQEISAT